MTRRSTAQSVADEAAFPVRVKVLVPKGGFGPQLHGELFAWLDREVGRADYARHPAKMFSEHAVAFHFRDVEPARRFLDAFPGLILADGTVTSAYASPALPFGRKRPSEPGKP